MAALGLCGLLGHLRPGGAPLLPPSNTALRGSLVLDGPRRASPCMLEPAGLWEVYKAAQLRESLLTDMATCASISLLSDSMAQLAERASAGVERGRALQPADEAQDWKRTGRFFAFGFADGAVSHAWFVILDAVVGEGGTLEQILLKTAGDALVYTPCWCVWFLSAFVVLEGRDVRSVATVLREDWLELYRGNVGFFLPLTAMIYGLVPRDERVLAFGIASLVYTTILSLWSNAKSQQETRNPVDGALTSSTGSALPRPARSTALLAFGVRRLIVRARLARQRMEPSYPPFLALKLESDSTTSRTQGSPKQP